jgi:hypothetical protein
MRIPIANTQMIKIDRDVVTDQKRNWISTVPTFCTTKRRMSPMRVTRKMSLRFIFAPCKAFFEKQTD